MSKTRLASVGAIVLIAYGTGYVVSEYHTKKRLDKIKPLIVNVLSTVLAKACDPTISESELLAIAKSEVEFVSMVFK